MTDNLVMFSYTDRGGIHDTPRTKYLPVHRAIAEYAKKHNLKEKEKFQSHIESEKESGDFPQIIIDALMIKEKSWLQG